MKLLFPLLTASLLVGCLSCNNGNTEKTSEAQVTEKKESSLREKNLAASHLIDEAFRTGDPSKLDEAVASDFVDHTDRGPMGKDSLKAMVVSMHTSSPDMKMDIVKEVADDEYVFSIMHWTGTSNGELGMPKGPYEMKALEVVRFKEGKAVEHWTYMEPSEVMKMMPPPASPKAATKK